MKNIKENQLKKAIFMTFDDFQKLVLKITDGLNQADYDFGICYYETEKAKETDTYYNGDILKDLGNYFDVNVTSLHGDDNEDVTGVWIIYK